MSYKEYCPRRETLIKNLSSAMASFSWVLVDADSETLLTEDKKKVEKIMEYMTDLYKKLKGVG